MSPSYTPFLSPYDEHRFEVKKNHVSFSVFSVFSVSELYSLSRREVFVYLEEIDIQISGSSQKKLTFDGNLKKKK